MKRAGPWLAALCLVWLVAAWAMPTAAEVPPGYEPQVKLLSPEVSGDTSANSSGNSAAMTGGSGGAQSAKSGGFRSWLADHGMGLVKGIGAGLIGAAVVVGVAALVVGAGAPLLLMAGAAVLGGAIYGALVGSKNFNWTEAIVGSVIGGVSAGVGSWIAGTGSSLLTRAGVAAVDMVGGGIASTASYLIHEPNPTLGGAAAAFGIGAGTAGLFMGGGAVVSKGWKSAKGALGLGKGAGRSAPKSGVIEATLVDEAGAAPPWGGTDPNHPTSSLEPSQARPSHLLGQQGADVTGVGGRVYWKESVHFEGKKVYQRGDLIDPDLVDSRGRSNLERMQKGLAPIGSDGEPINLHHMIQTDDGPVAEVTASFHQENYSIVHINSNKTPSGIDRTSFQSWKKKYWKDRATGLMNQVIGGLSHGDS